VVDVGGGYGALLVAILTAHPAIEGVLFDLPATIAAARPHLERAGVADRCRLVAGDFFEAVPAGADAYVLKSVLHDWDDAPARTILDACRAATGTGARLVIVERVMPERMRATPEHQNLARTDLTMLVALAAKERTEAEFRDLLAAAGFELTRTLPAGLGFSVLEARPV
jgi:methylase of polypeptide subunit release factors